MRADGRSHDLLCLDRIPRGADPATWLLAELGRAEGSPPVAPMPAIARSFVLVPAAAVVLGVRRAARQASASTAAGAAVIGAGAGIAFAALVVVTSLAGSLWLSVPTTGGTTRTVAFGPDPVSTTLAALAWGVVGGAVGGRGGATMALGQPPSPTSVKFDSIWVNRPHAAAQPASSRGNRSTGVGGACRSQMPKNVRP